MTFKIKVMQKQKSHWRNAEDMCVCYIYEQYGAGYRTGDSLRWNLKLWLFIVMKIKKTQNYKDLIAIITFCIPNKD